MSDSYLPDNEPRYILSSLEELAAKKLPHAPTFRKAAAEITRLREENARLREALAPFVDAGHLKVYISSASTKEECWVSINIKNRDLRAAAAAILEGVKNEN